MPEATAVQPAPAAPPAASAEPAAEPTSRPAVAQPPAPEARDPAKPADEFELDLFEDGKKEKFTKAQLRDMAQRAREFKRAQSMSSAAQKAAAQKEAQRAQIQAESESLLQQLVDDPLSVLSALGKDPEAYIAEKVAERAKRASLTPEQSEIERLQGELVEHKKGEAERQAQARTQAEQRLAESRWQALEKGLLEGMKSRGLPPTRELMSECASVGQEFIDAGLASEATYDDVVAEAHRRMSERDESLLKGKFSGLSGQPLLDALARAGVSLKEVLLATKLGMPKPGLPPKPAPARADESGWKPIGNAGLEEWKRSLKG